MPRYAWNKGIRNNDTEVVCMGCGKTFAKANSEATRRTNHYCSRQCFISDPLYKLCAECNEILPVECFYRQGKSELTGRTYYSSKCKACLKPVKQIRQQARNTIKHGVNSSFTVSDWLYILGQFEDKCAYCGEELVEACQDHFVPLTLGGTHTKNNVLPVCRSCNSSKNNALPQEWLTHAQFRQLSAVLNSLG